MSVFGQAGEGREIGPTREVYCTSISPFMKNIIIELSDFRKAAELADTAPGKGPSLHPTGGLLTA